MLATRPALGGKVEPNEPKRKPTINKPSDSMSKIIPTISSGTAGPLGVLHLPRLWQKASLAAVGKLQDDYPAAGSGFDQMVLDGIGIDRQEFLDYISAEKPTYTACEAWVLSKKGGALDQGTVATLNASIVGYNHDDSTRSSILGSVGRADDGSVLDAIGLNNLDDWHCFHQQEIA
ncbi:hypothetical protein BH23VER1_BH23VER1_34650 [soil metagenome]